MADFVTEIVSQSRLLAMKILARTLLYPMPTELANSGEEFNAGNGKTEIVPEGHARITYDNYGLQGEEGKRYQELLAKKEEFWTPTRIELRKKFLKKVGVTPLSEVQIEAFIETSEGAQDGNEIK